MDVAASVPSIVDALETKLPERLLAVGHGNLSTMEFEQAFLADDATETWPEAATFFSQADQQARFDQLMSEAFFAHAGDTAAAPPEPAQYTTHVHNDVIIVVRWGSGDPQHVLIVTIERLIELIPTVIDTIVAHTATDDTPQRDVDLSSEHNSTAELTDAPEEYDEATVIALVEEYLGQNTVPSHPQLKRVLVDELTEWRRRLEEVEETDPLHDKLQSELAAKQTKYNELERRERGPKQELLTVLESQFVADGFWLDSRILRAINYVLFGKDSATVVVENIIVEPDTPLDSDAVYTVSTTIRELAREERQAVDEYVSAK